MAQVKITVALQCQECNKIFVKRVGIIHAECPNCGSYDIDVAPFPHD